MEYTIQQLKQDKALQKSLKCGRVSDIKCYDGVCFLLTDKSIVVRTNLQTIRCIARPEKRDPNRAMFKGICETIQTGKCTNVTDLLSQLDARIETQSYKLEWLL